MKIGKILVAAAALTLSTFAVAHAAVFDFSYSFPETGYDTLSNGMTSASGLLTATDEGGGAFLATGISGEYNGQAIGTLEPVGGGETWV